EEVTPNPLSVGDIQRVLAKLLKESVSIRNLPIIFEVLADYGKMTSDTDLLTEYVRQGLARQITSQYTVQEGLLRVLTLSGKVEKTMAEAVQQTEHGNYLSLDPSVSQAIVESIAKQTETLSFQEQSPIVLCSPVVRMYVRQITERYFPHMAVLSYNELEANVEVQSVGVVDI
ncbi:FHIPEP family type III secretion protein, partial [Priestia megaterium]|uniref:FHIPEP family type III secretion protein n=1 Tax=Priestia megaterium TaxID=1404 RepID=UPI002E20FC99